MRYLIDCANPEKAEEILSFFPADGVTTNPTIAAREACDFKKMLLGMRRVLGPDRMLHAQTLQNRWADMAAEGEALYRAVGGNFYVKVPACKDGLRAMMALKSKGIGVTATAIFSAQQALLCARAGADFVAPYVNKLDDVGDGVGAVAQIAQLFKQFALPTKILSASFRNVDQVTRVALAGSDYATLPPAFFEKLIWHPMTDLAVQGFEADWKNVYGENAPISLMNRE